MLAERGSTLAIDLDPQGNLTTGLGIELADNQLTMYEVITERNPAASVIVKTKSGLYLMSADINLEDIQIFDSIPKSVKFSEMSQFHFSHLFKQSIGTSPYQYLLQQRIERAKQLLK